MAKNPKVIIGKGSPVVLKKYIASGGEGSIYDYQGIGCKIYHDPAKMIKEQKILELKSITTKNVMAPTDVIYDPKSHNPIGFSMMFVKDTEYLSRIFSKRFKKDNNITPEMVVELVKHMQEMLISLHKENIVVGDYNEMNTLTDKTYTVPYAIDVDSYQTKNFPCTAIMESVRDRTMPFGQFKESSDWFSWAVVSFQLYTGIHPYKGNHPNYKGSEMGKRMDDNISVFNKDVKLPKMFQDFSVIPKRHLDWYKEVFDKNDRSMPPFVDGAFFSQYQPIIVTDASGLIIDVVHDYKDDIIKLFTFSGDKYVITEKSIYKGITEIFKFTAKPNNILLAFLPFDGDIVIGVMINNMVAFLDLNRKEIGRIAAKGFMACNHSIYTISNGELIENHFTRLGRIKHIASPVSSVVDSSKIFPGVVVQDIFGKTKLTIPYEHKKCANIDISELDGHRIIDAKRIQRFCISISEKGGKFYRMILYFDKHFTSYKSVVNDDVTYRTVNFMVKQNGMAVNVKDGNTLEMFYDLTQGSKEITDSPIEMDMALYDGITQVLFVNDNKLQSATTK